MTTRILCFPIDQQTGKIFQMPIPKGSQILKTDESGLFIICPLGETENESLDFILLSTLISENFDLPEGKTTVPLGTKIGAFSLEKLLCLVVNV